MDCNDKSCTLPEGAYLTEEQIATIRSRVEDLMKSEAGESSLLTLLGEYVRANGRADEAFTSLEKLAGDVLGLISSNIPFPEDVRMSLVPVSLLTYFNLLLLTGVYDDDDMSISLKEVGEKEHRGNEA